MIKNFICPCAYAFRGLFSKHLGGVDAIAIALASMLGIPQAYGRWVLTLAQKTGDNHHL
ncbi:MAG: hypothetical protein ACFBSF_08850 [Leptolyngbyaceae cyanobacterium]